MTSQLDRIEAKLDQLLAAKPAAPRPASRFDVAPGAVAPASELDSQYGDPVIKKDPPRWSGPSFVGQPYSACSAEYLEEMAWFLEWKAGKNEEEGTEQKLKYAGYARKDAARARGWAQRVRDGGGDAMGRALGAIAGAKQGASDFFGGGGSFDSDEDIPF